MRGTSPGQAAIADIGIRHLRAFLVLAEQLSFTQAAASLYTTQPSLTRSIHRLEEALGARLFHRTTRTVRLSEAGVLLREELKELLPRLESALTPRYDIQTLRIGFSWLFPDELLQDTIVGFERAYGVAVDLVRRDERCAGVDEGAVQLAVLRGRQVARGLRTVRIAQEERVAAVARRSPLALRRSLAWSELAEHPMLINTVSGATQLRDWPEEARPGNVTLCGGFAEWLELIAAGHGIGVVPELALRRNPHPGVRFVPLTGAPPMPLWLARPSTGAHPLALRFMERVVGVRQAA
ncbi:LysR family transcriptional regulator [Streptomyces cyaneochromogenes]|uniref:LysR family transcriptional regulator n=1 Tax=Streptomyces cyaneochromogenes TaxID=2496836 RepID=A0A3Q9EMJ8_9ACTN|nr:LysR family transcriptional regulator [Streptomyces cyaneochromogenes]AZQ34555.1 LysR family transcriptional regulator [Streptomyces cyaneochromogenes]